MPRIVRRSFVKRPKRRTKWCGANRAASVPNQANIATSDAIPLCQPTTAVVDAPDPVVGWCRGSISLGRNNVTDTLSACAWAIVLGRTVPGATLPVQVFDPFLEADLERQDILGMGFIPIPPMLFTPSTDAVDIDRSQTVVDINIRVGRKLPRNANNLFLWVVSQSLDDAFTIRTSVRTLMKF